MLTVYTGNSTPLRTSQILLKVSAFGEDYTTTYTREWFLWGLLFSFSFFSNLQSRISGVTAVE